MQNNKEIDPIIVGLDIGTTKIVAIAARDNGYGKLQIVGYGKSRSAGMKNAEVVNIIDLSKSIIEAINACYQSNSDIKKISNVFVGIAGKHISCKQDTISVVRLNPDEEITQAEIDDLIKAQYNTYVQPGDEIINVIPKQYVIEGKHSMLHAVGCIGRKLEATYNIVSGNKDEIAKIEKAVKRAGLYILKMYLQPLASAMSVLSKDDKEAGVVIVDIGGGTTDIAVFQHGALAHTSVIDLAGNFITNEIYSSLQLFRLEEAEKLKIEYGSCLPEMVKPNTLATLPAMHGGPPTEISLYQLAGLIKDSIKKIIAQINVHLSNNGFIPKQMRGGMVITGGAALLSHLQQVMAFETSIPVRIGYPTEHLGAGYKKSLLHPENSTCYGLILYGLEVYKQISQEQQYQTINNDVDSTNNVNKNIDAEKKITSSNNYPSNTNQIPPKKNRLFGGLDYLKDMVNHVANEFRSDHDDSRF